MPAAVWRVDRTTYVDGLTTVNEPPITGQSASTKEEGSATGAWRGSINPGATLSTPGVEDAVS